MIPTLYKGTQDLKPQGGEDGGGAIVVVKKQVVSISKIVSDNTLLGKKSQNLDKKESESKKRDEKESGIEGKKGSGLIKALVGTIPQLGFLDAINRFITFTLLGWAFKKIYPYIPQILQFAKNIQPIVQFFETLSINFFKGVVDFVDFGYKAYDKVRDFTKNLGGEPFQKAFDDFSKNLNTFINLALVAGMLATGGPGFGKGGPKGKPGNVPGGGRTGYQYDPKRALVRKKYGDAAAKLYDLQIAKGKNTKQAIDIIESRYINKGRITPQRMSSLGDIKGSNLLSKGFGRAPGRLATRVLGRAGSRLARGIFARIPIIGGLIDFAISLAMGEKPGRAAARAVGASLGSILGSLIPVPFAGTILGGILGDIVGGALYDTLVTDKPKKMSGGGKVTTRKGKVVGGNVKRSVRKIYSTPKSKQIKSGASVGGEKKLKQLFPEPPKNQMNKMMNPYGFLTNTAKRFGEIPAIGPIFNIFGKVLKGDMPTKDDFRIVGSSFNAWINNAITKGLLQGNLMSAFAEGGVIDIETQMKRDISGWVEKSVEDLVKNKVTEAINELRKNLRMQPLSGSPAELPPGEGAGLYVSSDSPDFWLLATAALFENSDPQGAADVAQAIYNRVAMPGDPWNVDNSIRKTILNPGQFQPVSDYASPTAWAAIKTKEDALRFVKTYGKSQAQLETVAAAILDKNKQASARQFVGPRDSFRSYSFENANNHLADETEVRRLGHAFGFEPRGATIGMFKSGKLSAAVATDQKMMLGSDRGSLQKAEELARSMGLDVTSRLRPGSSGYHGLGRAIDFQTPGKPGNRGTPSQMQFAQAMIQRFGSSIKELIYTPLGFGIKDGVKVPLTTWGPSSPPWVDLPEGHPLKNSTNAIHYDHVHVAFKKGGSLTREKVKPLQREASYDRQDTQIFILPIETIKEVPMQSPLNRSSKYSSRVPM